MPLTPEPEVTEGSSGSTSPPKPRPFLRGLFVLISLAIGLFLVIFPWSDWWNLNYIQDLIPSLQNVWSEPSFRGALTGLGFVNLYIAFLQTLQLFRQS
jgi:hypothetical protein